MGKDKHLHNDIEEETTIVCLSVIPPDRRLKAVYYPSLKLGSIKFVLKASTLSLNNMKEKT